VKLLFGFGWADHFLFEIGSYSLGALLWVGLLVFFGGLKALEFTSKNGIRSVSLLIMWCLFWALFIGVPFIYNAFVL
jgi:hypothetical protein